MMNGLIYLEKLSELKRLAYFQVPKALPSIVSACSKKTKKTCLRSSKHSTSVNHKEMFIVLVALGVCSSIQRKRGILTIKRSTGGEKKLNLRVN
jgi:hypothetical protein